MLFLLVLFFIGRESFFISIILSNKIVWICIFLLKICSVCLVIDLRVLYVYFEKGYGRVKEN